MECSIFLITGFIKTLLQFKGLKTPAVVENPV